MKKNILVIVLIVVFILTIFGLTKCIKYERNKEFKREATNEIFVLHTKLENESEIHFTFDVPYKKSELKEALETQKITIEEFVKELKYIYTLKDGGSKIYQYKKKQKIFGDTNFYVLVCNSLNNKNDIFLAKHKKTLQDNCNIHANVVSKIKMTIKEGTLTRSGVTLIITDTNEEKNTYGTDYKIEKNENGVWKELNTKISNYVFAQSFGVNENNILELKVNWEWLYGKLKNGEYRIVKSVSIPDKNIEYYIATEFIIE